ncbi:MAG: helix-turn-helix transcriptional regulator [Spirochaetales bacterium]|nr:helix-turn-helix transcriptional regulator [Spirochaetales bacterium]
MVHLYLIFYIISLLSGIVIMGVLFFQYSLSHDKKILGFIRFKLSYTIIIIWALIILYLQINTPYSLMFLFSPIILILSIPLLGSFCYFMSLLRKKPWDRKDSFFLIFYSIWTTGCAVVSLIFSQGIIPFIAISGVLIAFFTLIFFIMARKNPPEIRAEKLKETRLDLFIIGSSISLGVLEFLFFRPFSIDKGFIFSLALSYIIINILDWREYLPRETRNIARDIPRNFFTYYKITPSEQRVAVALIKGMSNKEMAYTFGKAENTIKNQIYSLYKKTATRSRVEFINRTKEARMGQFTEISDYDL